MEARTAGPETVADPRVRREGELIRSAGSASAVALLLACAPVALAGPECSSVRTDVRLPDELVETSGVVFGHADPSILWTHNDDGSALFAIDSTGAILDRTRVRPRLRDWEDIAWAACEGRGSCLYLSDTGDNAERRAPGNARILRVDEPSLPFPDGPIRGEVFPLRFPDGPRDVEAIFVLPGERIHLVTKGRSDPVTVYRYPPPLRPDTVTLVEVQRLTDAAEPLASQVTGASVSEDGSVVAIRTYQTLAFYTVVADTLQLRPDGLVNLRSLREAQGEAVALGPNGLVVLTSEGGLLGAAASLNLMRCRL